MNAAELSAPITASEICSVYWDVPAARVGTTPLTTRASSTGPPAQRSASPWARGHRLPSSTASAAAKTIRAMAQRSQSGPGPGAAGAAPSSFGNPAASNGIVAGSLPQFVRPVEPSKRWADDRSEVVNNPPDGPQQCQRYRKDHRGDAAAQPERLRGRRSGAPAEIVPRIISVEWHLAPQPAPVRAPRGPVERRAHGQKKGRAGCYTQLTLGPENLRDR
jgi:hypothetical protein